VEVRHAGALDKPSHRSALQANKHNKKQVVLEYWNNGTYCGFFGFNPHHSTIPLFHYSSWVAGFARVGILRARRIPGCAFFSQLSPTDSHEMPKEEVGAGACVIL
jgi:hypothetical protein